MKSWSNRARFLNQQPLRKGPVIYWMNRDQRVHDNWALLEAQYWSMELQQPLVVVFTLMPSFGFAKNETNNRPYTWMKQGLVRVQRQLKELNIPFVIQAGNSVTLIKEWIEKIQAGLLITDFSPLKPMRQIRESLASSLSIPVIEVDAHNVCPAFFISDKQEWGAYTLRPKIHRALPQFLTPYPKLKKQMMDIKLPLSFISSSDELVGIAEQDSPLKALENFIAVRLAKYEQRNDPNADATSQLSAYLHFGNLSAQTIAIAVKNSPLPSESFLEELIVRKELADNYCLYQPDYDTVSGFPAWAKKTLNAHRKDSRDYLYTYEQWAEGKTHDDAWNAAQMQLVQTGYMHGYMRMYWAKKILEWTSSPEEALAIANRLNDTYELDGRDPNGYVGTAWAIGGVHDRPWAERKVFGMIRYMNAEGLKRKFDIGRYIRTWLSTGLGL